MIRRKRNSSICRNGAVGNLSRLTVLGKVAKMWSQLLVTCKLHRRGDGVQLVTYHDILILHEYLATNKLAVMLK